MKDMNKIFLIGRLGSDPLQRHTKSGVSVVNFSLATSHRVRNTEGSGEQYGEETQWHRIVVWGKLSEICAQYLKKGDGVFVDGTLRSRKFLGRDDQFRYFFEVHAEGVHFMNGKSTQTTQQETLVEVVDSSIASSTSLETDFLEVAGTA